MTPDEARRRVAAIRTWAGDEEVAHSMEDQLHEDALAAIASGADDPQALAAECLRTREIKFDRWYS